MNITRARRSSVVHCLRFSAILMAGTGLALAFQIREALNPAAPAAGSLVLFVLAGLAVWQGRLLDSAYQENRRRVKEEASLKADQQICFIDELLARGRQRYLACQQHDVAELNVLKPGGIRALAGVQRMLDALDERGELLRSLTKSGRVNDLLKAADISTKPLCFENTSWETMAGREMPELTPDAWEETLERLFAQIER